jgi:hypothetical protein
MDGWIGCTWPLSGFTLNMIEKGDLTMNFGDHGCDLVNKKELTFGGFHLEIYKELNVFLPF